MRTFDFKDKYNNDFVIYFDDYKDNAVTKFVSRVEADGGTVEGAVCLYSVLNAETNPFFDRVEADGGIIERSDCLYEYTDQYPSDHHFTYGATDALRINWYGDRFKSIIPSKAEISLVIETEYDELSFEDMIGNRYIVNIYRNGHLYWVGYTEIVFANIQYEGKPYTAKIAAQDGLSIMTKYQPIMIDFKYPFLQHRYTLLEYLNILLPQVTTNTSVSTPPTINYAKRTELDYGKAIEEITIDPLMFMESDSIEYKSKWDILDAILYPLNLKLFQFSSSWWLVSKDINYTDSFAYNIYDTFTGASLGSGIQDRDVIAVDCESVAYPDITLFPSNREIRLTEKFAKTTNLFAGFTNNKGNFYLGSDGIYLEGDSTNHLSSDRFSGNLFPLRVPDNRGSMVVYQYSGETDATTAIFTSIPINRTEQTVKLEFQLTPYGNPIVGTSVNIPTPTRITYTLSYNWTEDSVIKTLYLNKNSNGEFEWKDTLDWMESADTEGTVTISTRAPETNLSHYYKFELQAQATSPRSLILRTFMDSLTLTVDNSDYSTLKYKRELTTYLNERADSVLKKDIDWGFSLDNDSDDRAYSQSGIINKYGVSTDRFVSEDGTVKTAVNWLIDYLSSETGDIMRRIKLDLLRSDINPFTAFVDSDNRGYEILSIEYNNNGYTLDLGQAKYLNIGAGDFDELAYDTSFYKN